MDAWELERYWKRMPEAFHSKIKFGNEFKYMRKRAGFNSWRSFQANQGVEFGPRFGVEVDSFSGRRSPVWCVSCPIALLWDDAPPQGPLGDSNPVKVSDARTVAQVWKDESEAESSAPEVKATAVLSSSSPLLCGSGKADQAAFFEVRRFIQIIPACPHAIYFYLSSIIYHFMPTTPSILPDSLPVGLRFSVF